LAATPEGAVKKRVRAWLKARGIWYFQPAANGFGVSGIPDFIAIISGIFVGIETKAPKRENTLTVNQKARLAEIQAAGGIALVVSDVSQLEELHELIRQHPHTSRTDDI
jgi:Holliday junction resolvase